MIVMQRLIKVDGKVRTDMFYPAGFMDVVQIEKTKDSLSFERLLGFRLVLQCLALYASINWNRWDTLPGVAGVLLRKVLKAALLARCSR